MTSEGYRGSLIQSNPGLESIPFSNNIPTETGQYGLVRLASLPEVKTAVAGMSLLLLSLLLLLVVVVVFILLLLLLFLALTRARRRPRCQRPRRKLQLVARGRGPATAQKRVRPWSLADPAAILSLSCLFVLFSIFVLNFKCRFGIYLNIMTFTLIS